MKNIVLLLVMIFPVHFIMAQSGGIGGVSKKSYFGFEKDTSKLVQRAKPVLLCPPIFGKKIRNNGMILPLPFGAGVRFLKFEQPYIATNLKLSNYENNIEVYAKSVTDNTDIGEISVAFKPDFWLLPFLNVYGLIGYTSGYTNMDITVNSFEIENDDGHDLTLDSTFRFMTNPDFYGKTLGFGTTLSTGIKSYFVMFNYEYSQSRREDYKSKLIYQHFRAKAGILLGQNNVNVKGAFWLGTSFMHDKHDFEGLLITQDVLPGNEWLLGEMILFQGVDEISYPWNFLFGGSFNVNDHHIVMLEIGMFYRQQINLSYSYRF